MKSLAVWGHRDLAPDSLRLCKRQRRAGQLLMGELQEVGIPGLTRKPRMCWDKESTSIYSDRFT